MRRQRTCTRPSWQANRKDVSRKRNSSIWFAVVLAVLASGWVASGMVGDDPVKPETQRQAAKVAGMETAFAVRTRDSQAELHRKILLIRGRTEADRVVEIKTETEGQIIELPVEEGDTVESGVTVAQIDPRERPASLQEAQALLTQKRLELEAARKLQVKGFRAETQLAASEAEYDAARAMVRRMEVEISMLTVKAPFGGYLEHRYVELGDFVESGDRIGQIIDLDPIILVAQISERDISGIDLGVEAEARLANGTRVKGIVRFIGATADPQTRTFRAEIEVDNPDRLISAGMTAEVALPLETVMAHFISPAILTLSDKGQIGVMTVDEESRAHFVDVQIVEDEQDGVWVSGLSNEATLIVVGQEFITDGQNVKAVDVSGIVGGGAGS